MRPRKIFFLLLVLGVASVSGQSKKPEVITIKTIEKMLSAHIDDKYSITIYLKLDRFSGDHDGIYSVKGWYYYDDKKIKIPLVGICDTNLTLFNIASETRQKEILSMETQTGEIFWDALERLKNNTDYNEKFSFDITDSKISGTWKKGKTELGVKLYAPDLDIFKVQEFLQIPNVEDVYSINLYDLNLYATDFAFDAMYRTKENVRVLLEYEFTSSPNHQGMCGAGIEKGYITLNFDARMNFQSAEDLRIESCLDNIMSETDPNDDTVFKRQNHDEKEQNYKIDLAKAQVIKLKS
jgi:hypothetical protein